MILFLYKGQMTVTTMESWSLIHMFVIWLHKVYCFKCHFIPRIYVTKAAFNYVAAVSTMKSLSPGLVPFRNQRPHHRSFTNHKCQVTRTKGSFFFKKATKVCNIHPFVSSYSCLMSKSSWHKYIWSNCHVEWYEFFFF